MHIQKFQLYQWWKIIENLCMKFVPARKGINNHGILINAHECPLERCGCLYDLKWIGVLTGVGGGVTFDTIGTLE